MAGTACCLLGSFCASSSSHMYIGLCGHQISPCCSSLPLGHALGCSSGWSHRECGSPGCWLQAPAFTCSSPEALDCPLLTHPTFLSTAWLSRPPQLCSVSVPALLSCSLLPAVPHLCIYHHLCEQHCYMLGAGPCLASHASTDLLEQQCVLLLDVVAGVRRAMGSHVKGDLCLHRLILLFLGRGASLTCGCPALGWCPECQWGP